MKSFRVLVWGLFTTFMLGCGSTSTVEDTPVETPVDNTPIRVACIGDSITEGTGLRNPSKDSYPTQLQQMLGEGWNVQNFGKKSATLMKAGSFPYWNTAPFTPSHDFKPDIVIIMLGTNDAKPGNWANNAPFVSDYTALIESYKTLDSQPSIYICYPPPVYAVVAGITDARIKNEVIPRIAKVASDTSTPVIDIYNTLKNKASLFPDKVHPNTEGARQLAEVVYEKIY